jgi:hypothetical protein
MLENLLRFPPLKLVLLLVLMVSFESDQSRHLFAADNTCSKDPQDTPSY